MTPARAARPGAATQRGRKLSPALGELLSRGFADRIARFKRDGRAVTLSEVPEVLDALLDLNTTELNDLVRAAGLRYSALQNAKKVPRGPATAPQVLRILSGAVTNGAPELPASTADVIRQVKRIDAELQQSRSSLHRVELQRERAALLEVGTKLLHIKDAPISRKLGFQVSTTLSVRLVQPLGPDRRAGGVFDLAKTQLNSKTKRLIEQGLRPSVSVQTGVFVGQLNRLHGRRRFECWVSPGTGCSVGGVNYAFRKSGNKAGGGINLPFVSLCSDAMRGKFLAVGVPLIGAVNIGERYVGIGCYLNRLPIEVPFAYGVGVPFLPGARFLPGFDIGLNGDALQYVMGPIVNAAEAALTKASGLFNRKQNGAASGNTSPTSG